MSIIDESIRNLELSLAELKAARKAEQSREAVTNQEQETLTDEELLNLSNIRF